MFGFFINLSGLLSIFSAPFNAAVSAGGAIASARAERRAKAVTQRDLRDLSVIVPRDGLPPRNLVFLAHYDRWFRVVDDEPHIPRVKRK